MSDLPPPPPGNEPPAGPPPGSTPPPPPPGGYGAPPPRGGFDVGAGFSWAWQKFQQNAAALVVSTLVVGLIGAALYFVVYLPFVLTSGPSFDVETGQYDSGPSFVTRQLVTGLAILVAGVPAQALASNLVRMVLTICDGGTVSVGDLFRFTRGVGPTLLTALLLSVGSALGYVLCFLPGIVFGFGAAFTFYFFHDRGLSPVESITASFGLFGRNFGAAIVIVLLAGIVGGAGIIVCCVGLLVSAPIAQLFTAHQFRSITGGAIAP